ncbi:MAG: hypothetical protein ACYC56_01830 [Candidatus Aquicultor sp.]
MTDEKVEEVLTETSEGAVDSKRQIAKYVVFWVAIVAVFLVGNIVIKSLAAPSTAELGQGGYYASGQPVASTVGGSNSAAGGASTGGYGACGGTGSCCSSSTGQVTSTSATGVSATSATALDVYDASGKLDVKKLENAAIAWYAKKAGDANVTAEVKDFGCHQQITIKKGGKAVKELAFRNGQLEAL